MKSLLINDNNLPAFEQPISELFRSQLEKSLNEMLAYELAAFLDYERYEPSDNLNLRNGSYQRKLDIRYGQITLNILRDRLGEFYTVLIPRYRRRDFSTDQTILDLYEEGMTNTEIAGIIRKLCGDSYFKQVYTAKDKQTSLKELDTFLKKWRKKYPSINKSLTDNEHLFTFYDYPESVRPSIYTTNLIEGNNKQLKRYFKEREIS